MTTETPTTNASLRRFARLYREKLELTDRIKEVNGELDSMQDGLLNYFGDMGWEKPPRVQAQHPDTEEYGLLAEVLELSAQLPDDLTERIKAALADKALTLYINTQLWASRRNPETDSDEAICNALVEAGYGDVVRRNFNTQTLSAVARDLEREGKEFPPAVLQYIEVRPKVDIRGRR